MRFIIMLNIITLWVCSIVIVSCRAELKPIKRRLELSKRVVPWCANGHDEPEFQQYPLNEFKPFLDRDFEFATGNDGYKYEVNLYQTHVDQQKIGDAEILQNTAHFQFRAIKRRFYEKSVDTDFDENPMEGLVVHMVSSPFGVGLPFGTFLETEDMNCYDCQYPLGQVVGCKKKTWLNFMHPTVLVYHHKMSPLKEEVERTQYLCEDQLVQKFCDGEKSGSKCDGPEGCTDKKQCRIPDPEYVCYKDDAPVDPEKKCTIIPPDTVCDKTTDPAEECKMKKHETKPDITCNPWTSKYYGRSSEVHGNIIWHTHPCHYTTRVRFIALAVHSFHKGMYSVWRSGEFALPTVNSPGHNMYIPSPIFTGLRHVCEPKTAKNERLQVAGQTQEKMVDEIKRNSNDFQEFDYSLSYDLCMTHRGDGVMEKFCKYNVTDSKSIISPRVNTKNLDFQPPPRCIKQSNKDDDIILDHSAKDLVPTCEGLCPSLPTTTAVTPTEPPDSIFKRSLHGGINFVTNFCIMPVCIFVARFYKETYNESTIKGGKPWYWIHLFGAGGSSVLMYIGYFHKNYVSDANHHVIAGNTYIVVLAIAYISAWIRHKDPVIGLIAVTVHGASGYICFFLALVCMHTSPNLSIYPMIFVYCSVFALGLFYIGMTCHICILDKRFGLQPRRKHFPTVEVKFDELPVPKSGARKVSLIVLGVLVFLLTLGTIFF